MYQTQLDLSKRDCEQNKAFFRALYSSEDLKKCYKEFQILDSSVSLNRQIDKSMTLDSFLDLLNEPFFVHLQIGSRLNSLIRYRARGASPKKVGRFALIELPLTLKNYQAINRIFNEAYKQDLGFVKNFN